MRIIDLETPYWAVFDLTFAEEADDAADKGDDDKDDEDEDDDDEKDGDSDKDEKSEKEDTAGLKSALEKERRDRKKADKELKALRKFKEDEENKSKSEKDLAADKATKAEAKAARLAEGFKKTATNLEIIKIGGKLGFADIDDALSLVKRDDIDVEQDEDDPSDVSVDAKTVETALKALLKKKPHLAAKKSDEDDEDDEDEGRKATGGKVGSRGTRDKGKLKDEELIGMYPILKR